MVYRDKEYEVPAGMTVRDALKKVGLQTETTLAVLEGKLLTDDTILQDGMKLKLVAVISGGCISLSEQAEHPERSGARPSTSLRSAHAARARRVVEGSGG